MIAADFVVVGGGIAGCSVAFELAERGARVRLYERASVASGASGLSPGNLLALDADSRVQRMRDISLGIYESLAEGPYDPRLATIDQLQIALEESDLGVLDALAVAAARFGLQAEPLNPRGLARRFPGLAPALAGGLLVERATVILPAAATRALAEAARSRGVELITGCRVAEVTVRGGRAVGVVTDGGSFAAGAVILAAGPWLPDFVPAAPIAPTRGWLLKVTGVPLDWPMVREIHSPAGASTPAGNPTITDLATGLAGDPVAARLLLRPLGDGSALIGSLVGAAFGETLTDAEAAARLARLLASRAPGLAGARVIDAWSALRPMTPDGLPLAGPTQIQGLHLHGGHGRYGLMAAPASARWLAEELLTGRSAPELADLRPSRYGL